MTRFSGRFVLALNPSLQPRHKPWWAALCLAVIAAIATADYLTGYEISLSLLYLAPVFIGTWMLGLAGGVVMAALSAASWFAVFLGLHPYPSSVYLLWDALIRAGTWIIFALVIHRLKLALAHSDERFVTVLEGLDASVYVSDTATGELLYSNEEYRKAFAARPPTQGPNANDGEFQDAASGRWYLGRARAIRWVDGRAVRLNIATDVTERRRAEELAREQQAKLQMTARLVTAGEMASTLAHELNQPLAAIANYNQGCVRRLRSGDWNADELLDALEKSSAQAERAGRVIQRVREFVRRREPRLAPCSINDVIAEVASMVESETGKNAIDVRLDLAPELPAVKGDKVMLEQVLLNLIINAIEAMQEAHEGRRELAIRSARDGAGAVEVSVTDNGRGLPEQLADNLFTAFFTTKPEGTGMGLQICRSIIEAHHGRLWAQSNPRHGSTFRFTLPVA